MRLSGWVSYSRPSAEGNGLGPRGGPVVGVEGLRARLSPAIPDVSGGACQSVMTTAPKGSAEFTGMNEIVSRDARHKILLTPMPPPMGRGGAKKNPDRTLRLRPGVDVLG